MQMGKRNPLGAVPLTGIDFVGNRQTRVIAPSLTPPGMSGASKSRSRAAIARDTPVLAMRQADATGETVDGLVHDLL